MDDEVFTSSVTYRDPKAAVRWLGEAFGFEVTMAIEGPPESPEMCHYEMSCQGRGRIMLGAEWDDWASSPSGVGGKNTQTVHVKLPDGLDEHCERARAAGRDDRGGARGSVLRRPQLPGDRSRGAPVDIRRQSA